MRYKMNFLLSKLSNCFQKIASHYFWEFYFWFCSIFSWLLHQPKFHILTYKIISNLDNKIKLLNCNCSNLDKGQLFILTLYEPIWRHYLWWRHPSSWMNNSWHNIASCRSGHQFWAKSNFYLLSLLSKTAENGLV